ncbi:alpha/beta fold hydrolase [Thioclava sp. FR2]|uniref:alpha/beta fold hydrolase n=1 Tax=Thioclava sp. FR2 TaxID=3445780 RepID=UPI003EBFBA1E
MRIASRSQQALVSHPPVGPILGTSEKGVHTFVTGSGPDLVLIHGANGNLRDFTLGFAERLSSSYRVIAVDRPGLGHSKSMPDGQTSVHDQARQIRAALREIGVQRPIVLGQSYGGAVALAWALQEEPAALVLVSAATMPWPGSLDPWYRITANPIGRHLIVPLASAFVPKSYMRRAVAGVFAPQAAPENYSEHLGTNLTLRYGSLSSTVQQINGLRADVVQMQSHYPMLNLPVELVHGDADTIVPLTIHAEPLAKLLPNANLTVLQNVGHMPHHTHVEEVVNAIDRAALRAGLR